jgi:hypothetical protein
LIDIRENIRVNPLSKRRFWLQSHPNLSILYETLPFHTKRIVQAVLETGVTLPLMEKASHCMDEEFQDNVILQILANGNVLLPESVTATVLDEIEFLLQTVYDERDDWTSAS